ncbi:cyclin-like protein [Violaceomyces palustris]|uniref:Cyclin-like protein n=1 Tax=Violaceomyces palustris TaxID=1673888 RepID=A0ACD0NQA4_9BASI|nr:cyclin-like protein [Violaceomyces palustris]
MTNPTPPPPASSQTNKSGPLTKPTQATPPSSSPSSSNPNGNLPPEAAYQWLFSKSDLQHTPSVKQANMSSSTERQLRGKGIHIIYKIGEFLRLGQHVLCTACTFFHRFYMRRPLQYGPNRQGFSHYEMAASCVFLAGKVEESHRKLPSIIDATMASLDKSPMGIQRWMERSFRANPNSKEYERWRDCILLNEEALLETLCFDLVIEHPHEILVRSCQELGVDRSITRLAWTILNDCMRDPICLMYQAPVLAAGAFKKACQVKRVNVDGFTISSKSNKLSSWRNDGEEGKGGEEEIETDTDWLDVFDCDEDEVQQALIDIETEVYSFHGGSKVIVSGGGVGTSGNVTPIHPSGTESQTQVTSNLGSPLPESKSTSDPLENKRGREEETQVEEGEEVPRPLSPPTRNHPPYPSPSKLQKLDRQRPSPVPPSDSQGQPSLDHPVGGEGEAEVRRDSATTAGDHLTNPFKPLAHGHQDRYARPPSRHGLKDRFPE